MIIAAFMLVAIAPLKAQEWIFKTLPPDELKGTEKDSIALYNDEEYTVLISFTNNYVRVRAKECIFDYHREEYHVLIGIYDADDNLLNKQNIICWLSSTRSRQIIEIVNKRHTFNPNHPADTIVTRIIEHLNNGSGYVRFVAPMYLCNDLDFKLPCFGNQ